MSWQTAPARLRQLLQDGKNPLSSHEVEAVLRRVLNEFFTEAHRQEIETSLAKRSFAGLDSLKAPLSQLVGQAFAGSTACDAAVGVSFNCLV